MKISLSSPLPSCFPNWIAVKNGIILKYWKLTLIRAWYSSFSRCIHASLSLGPALVRNKGILLRVFFVHSSTMIPEEDFSTFYALSWRIWNKYQIFSTCLQTFATYDWHYWLSAERSLDATLSSTNCCRGWKFMPPIFNFKFITAFLC